jgi:hypothetical protein
MKLKYLIFSLMVLCSSQLLAGSIHYYDLKQRPASEVIPLVQPFLEAGEVVSGDGYQLFIKATPARADELKALIVNIDKPLATYKISVSNDQSLLTARHSVSGSARIESGDTTVEAGKSINKDSSAEIRIDSSKNDKHSGQTQYLKVQQGKAAFISTANLQIIPAQHYSNGTNRDYVTQELYPASQDGFFIVVRSASDNNVNIKIQSAASNKTERRVYHGYGQKQTYLDTTLQVPMNSWFEIGGIDESSTDRSSELLSRSQSSKQTGNAILIRIERVN